jgi:hypothetical protein
MGYQFWNLLSFLPSSRFAYVNTHLAPTENEELSFLLL